MVFGEMSNFEFWENVLVQCLLVQCLHAREFNANYRQLAQMIKQSISHFSVFYFFLTFICHKGAR